ncbi:EF-hand domain-containing protein [Sphingomonas sp. 37zxx]|uniref:EF-hand domain-containing protein n=1 Tax=Sphingomonas sp. 37zxx TaxID=1550073 RepID=UPI00053BE134|nr:EF-hand domain-containing protein [Sphingomonas sp. 37zxx]
MKFILFSVALAAIGCTMPVSAALAQTGEQISAKFKSADKDSDGKLTLGEAKVGMPRVANNFTRIDRDKKGYVTESEIIAVMKR